MLDPVRAKTRIIGLTAIAFLGGVLLASGMEWTTGSHASSLFQSAPAGDEIRPVAELSESFISIAESVTPAVVSIRTERRPRRGGGGGGQTPENLPEPFRRFFENQPDQPTPQGGGTGFLISNDGYIITNNHVVADADVINVVTMDRREFTAELVGRDPTTDIAVIRIQGQALPIVRLGDPSTTRVGEWVLAIGNPLGLDFTVTAGIVSAKDRGIGIIQRSIRDNELAQLAIESFIQTDAAINPGNSGGPLVNIRGEVIGVNTAIASNTGLSAGYGFAVPINLARHVAEDLIRYGRWRRSVLGVQIQEVTVEDVEVFDLPAVAGALVQTFSGDDSPAARAGLRQGDVIIGVDGETVTRVNELQRIIASNRPGDRVTLDVVRYGERMNVEVQLVEAPSAPRPVAANNPVPASPPEASTEGRLGVRAVPLTRERADALGYAEPGGIVIEDFEPGSPLGQRFPARGYTILRIDGDPVDSIETFQRIMSSKSAGSVVSLVLGSPAGDERIVNVRLRG